MEGRARSRPIACIAAAACGVREFGCHLHDAQDTIPDQAVNAIHATLPCTPRDDARHAIAWRARKFMATLNDTCTRCMLVPRVREAVSRTSQSINGTAAKLTILPPAAPGVISQ
jgi:hypothetical protein